MTQQELPVNVRVVRLFGADRDAVTRTMDALRQQGSMNVQSMVRGSETLVVLQSEAGTFNEMCAELETGEKCLRAACPDAVYGTGATTLTTAVVEMLRPRHVLFACADAETGAQLEPKLENLTGAEEVYDFGAQSYAHPKIGKKIAAAGRRAEEQSIDDPVRATALRVRETYRLSGADWALGAAETAAGRVAVVGGKKECCARLLQPDESVALALLDLMRRAVLELAMPDGTRWLRYGRKSGFDAAGPDSGETTQSTKQKHLNDADGGNGGNALESGNDRNVRNIGNGANARNGADIGTVKNAANAADNGTVGTIGNAANMRQGRTETRPADTVPRMKGEARQVTPRPADTAPQTHCATGKESPAAPQTHRATERVTERRHAGWKAAAALVVVLVVAAAAVGGVWIMTGGDIASFWERSGLRQFNLSNAALLWLNR